MAIENKMTVAERLDQLMNHLGIDKAHFAGREAQDWMGSVISYPDKILSMILVGPEGLDTQALNNLASRMLIISSDRGGFTETAQKVIDMVSSIESLTISNYEMLLWTDVIADKTDVILKKLLPFLAKYNSDKVESIGNNINLVGEIAGISYQVRGSGPPVLLLPLGLAPSQWEPLIPRLSESYCTITLGGPHLGPVFRFESRGADAGYLRVFQNLIVATQLQPEESVLDIGSGTGVLDRWLAHTTNRKNRITGIELNGYLVREATQLAHKEGLGDVIKFREGDATSLPAPDNSFDLSFSSTVMEEVDADKMLAEMVRVTKPGGRVAVIVRAVDIPWVINVSLQPNLKKKIESSFFDVSSKGCADSSLYKRFYQAGLTQIKKLPQLMVIDNSNPGIRYLTTNLFLSKLDNHERDEWYTAITEAEDTFFVARVFHCAVGTKAI